MKKKTNTLSLVIVIVLVLTSGVILWNGFRKKAPAPKNVSSQQNPPTSSSKQEIFFASNGKNSVYKIKKGDKWSVFWNGQEGKEYDFVSNPVFSADGSQLAYAAELGGQAYVVVNNNQEIYAYQKASYIVFSENGQVIAFAAAKNDGTFVVITSNITIGSSTATTTENQVNGQIGTATNSQGEQTAVIISADGSQVAYIIQNGNQIAVVAGGQTGANYTNITDFTLNNDGTYSYTATTGNTTVTVVNNVVTSSTPSTSTTTTTPTNVSNTTTSIPNSNTSSNEPSATLEGYKYPISTQKDIDRSDDELNYSSDCTDSENCNF